MLAVPTQVCTVQLSDTELLWHRSQQQQPCLQQGCTAQEQNRTGLDLQPLVVEKSCPGLAGVSHCLMQIPECIYYRIIEYLSWNKPAEITRSNCELKTELTLKLKQIVQGHIQPSSEHLQGNKGFTISLNPPFQSLSTFNEFCILNVCQNFPCCSLCVALCLYYNPSKSSCLSFLILLQLEDSSKIIHNLLSSS